MCFALVNKSVAIKNQFDTHPHEYLPNKNMLSILSGNYLFILLIAQHVESLFIVCRLH
jgi:hypothetical protein